MQTTTIYLIRHGEVYNPDRVLYGNVVDVPLSEVGFDQMRALGERLRDLGVVPDIIFSSPLKRAKQSVQALKEFYRDTPVVFDLDLRDADHPELKGLGTEWLKSIGGNPYDYDGKELQGITFESPDNQVSRITTIVDKIKKQYEGKTVFVISHGDPMAFSIWRLLHPEGQLPSISELAKSQYLKKGEAFRIVFDGNGKVLEHELIARDESSVKGEREY